MKKFLVTYVAEEEHQYQYEIEASNKEAVHQMIENGVFLDLAKQVNDNCLYSSDTVVKIEEKKRRIKWDKD